MTRGSAAEPQTPILYVHGADATPDDPPLPALSERLGALYKLTAPNLGLVDSSAWTKAIRAELDRAGPAPIVIGHSLGGSHALKCLAELGPSVRVRGFIGLACPMWRQPGWENDAFALPIWAPDALARLPMRFFHARDDDLVPPDHMEAYARLFPNARCHTLSTGGHNCDADLSAIAMAVAEL